MGEVVRICDFHLRRLARDASELKGQLFEFAKSGGPVVEGSQPIDKWAGSYVPDGIDGLLYESSAGWIEPDAG